MQPRGKQQEELGQVNVKRNSYNGAGGGGVKCESSLSNSVVCTYQSLLHGVWLLDAFHYTLC